MSQLPKSISLVVFYDSLNPLHLEWLQNQTPSQISELWVDISNEYWCDLLEDVVDLCDIDPTKVQTKNRPTFVCKTGNRLYRASLASEIETESLKASSHS